MRSRRIKSMGRKNHDGTEDGKEILAKEKGLSTTRDSKREEMQENYKELLNVRLIGR